MLPTNKTRSKITTFVFAFFILLWCQQFAYSADDVTLQWDANTEPDLLGYNINYGTASRNYSQSVDVGDVTTYRLFGLTEGETYYIAVTAYDNKDNESGYSNEVIYTVPYGDVDGDGYTEDEGDCNDNDATVNPGAADICGDGIDQDCSGSDLSCNDLDKDGDGYTENNGDCNDNDTSVNPGAAEVPYNDKDDDCEAGTPDNDLDLDGYLYAADCNDSDSRVHRGALEICGDGIDQNCSGADLSCADVDNDGDGYTANQGDCNDGDPVVHPGASEVPYNGKDDDCNGATLDIGGDTDGDGLSDALEVELGTDPNDADSDQDGLIDGDEANIYGTDPLATDSDQDGLTDGDEVFGYSTNPNRADSDNDGLTDTEEINAYGTDPNNDDSDGDGLKDGFEIENGYSPLIDDSGNYPDNFAPAGPVLGQPNNGDQNITLVPTLNSGVFSDADGDAHAATQWQISTGSDFAYIVYNLMSARYLTSLPLQESILGVNTTYYWRVKYIDSRDAESEWSDSRWFKTVLKSSLDKNSNGIPDTQEVQSDSVDLNHDGVPDITQPHMKLVNTIVGQRLLCLMGSENVTSIEALQSIDADQITDGNRKPKLMPFGLISFRVFVDNPGETAYISVLSTKSVNPTAKWYKYDLTNGWYDYSDNVAFSPDRTMLTIRLTDGGIGDADGAVNGVIVDPSGLAAYSEDGDSFDIGEDLLKSCFIGASAQASGVEDRTGSLRSNTVGLPGTAGFIILGWIGLIAAIFRKVALR